MKRFFLLLFLVALGACTPFSLTEEEKAWLKQHPVIRLAPDPDFPPFEFFDKWGRYQGIGADVVREFSQWSGVVVEVYRYSNWSEVLLALSNREIDMINCALDTPPRRVYARFPSPYLPIPNVIVRRKGEEKKKVSFDDIRLARVGMVRSYGMVDILTGRFPEFKPVLYPNAKAGFEALVRGDIDYFILNLGTASHLIMDEGFISLEIGGTLDTPDPMGFGVRSDWPELVGILEKFQKGYLEKKRSQILLKWIAVGRDYINKPALFSLVMVIVGISLAIAGILTWLLIRSRHREKDISLHEQELEKALREIMDVIGIVLDKLPTATMIVDKNEQIVYTNSVFQQIFGWNKEDLKTFYHFYQIATAQESDRRLLWEKWEIVVTRKKENPYVLLENFLLIDSQGKNHPCRVDIHRLGDKYLLSFLDYSEGEIKEREYKYKLNQMLVAMKEKDLLFLELEHRVRNVLQLMRSFVRLHEPYVDRYSPADLLNKITCGVDLLTIIENYAMRDIKLTLYDVRIPVMDFVRHVEQEFGLEIDVSCDSVQMNGQSLLVVLFIIQEGMFLMMRESREALIHLSLREGSTLVLQMKSEKSLPIEREDLAVSMDFASQVGGILTSQTKPVFELRFECPIEKLQKL